MENLNRLRGKWLGGVVAAIVGTLLFAGTANASGNREVGDCTASMVNEFAVQGGGQSANENVAEAAAHGRVRVPKVHGLGGLYSPARLLPEMVGLPVMTAEELARKFSTHPTMKPYGVGYAEGAPQARLPRRRGAVQEIIGLHGLEDEEPGAVTVCAGPGYQYINLEFFGGQYALPVPENKPMSWEALEASTAGLVRDIMGVFPGQYDMVLCKVSRGRPSLEFTYCVVVNAGEYRVALQRGYCQVEVRVDDGLCRRFRAVLQDNIEAALAEIPSEDTIREGIRQAAAALWLEPDEVRLAGDVLCAFRSTDAKEFYMTVVPREALKASARIDDSRKVFDLEGGIRSAVVYLRGDEIQDVVLKPLALTAAESMGYDLEWLAHVEATGASDSSPDAKGREWVEQMSARYCAAQ